MRETRLLNTAEVAEFLHVSVETIRRWTNAGKLSFYRLDGKGDRRFSQEQIQTFLNRHEQRPQREIEAVKHG